MTEFVTFWELTREVTLDNSRKDSIRWRWTADGEYTTKSAYRIQFEGTFSKMKIMPIWKAKAEPKCHVLAWTLLHKKILTANNLSKRNWQHNWICNYVALSMKHQHIYATNAHSQKKFGNELNAPDVH